jgi:hypothetical protein
MIRQTFRCKREIVTGAWRKLRNEELNYSQGYWSTDVRYVRLLKSQKLIWTGHLARMRKMINA